MIGNAGDTIGYTELQAVAPAIDAALTVTDADNATLAGATVSIRRLPGGRHVCNFTNQNGITGSYNAATGVLTLSGTATRGALSGGAGVGDVLLEQPAIRPASAPTPAAASAGW